MERHLSDIHRASDVHPSLGGSRSDASAGRILRIVDLVLMTLAVLGVFVGVLLLVGHYSQASSTELVDWRPTRSPELEAQNEIDDVRQMLEAQNEMRRRRGAPEVDEAALRAEVEAEELERLRRGDPFEA